MMKKITSKQKNFSRGMIAAVLCGLLAVGGAAFIGARQTADEIREQNSLPQNIDQIASIPDESEEWLDQAQADNTASEEETAQTMTEPKKEEAVTKDTKDAAPKQLTGFVMPVDGNIITPYSDGMMVKSLTLNDWRTHDGVDIAAEPGTPVKACNSGVVTDIISDPLWGMTVTVSHSDGSKSYYMGLSNSIPVNKGQKIALGEVIGSVGDTAEIEQALDSHLHFAMKKDGNWIDPLQSKK